MFVEQNLPRLDCWMQQVANGIPKVDMNCEPIRDTNGSVVYLVKPDPATAIKLVADICEYHLPKLSRQDVQLTGVLGSLDSISPAVAALLSMPEGDITTHLRGINATDAVPVWLEGEIIDVEAEKK